MRKSISFSWTKNPSMGRRTREFFPNFPVEIVEKWLETNNTTLFRLLSFSFVWHAPNEGTVPHSQKSTTEIEVKEMVSRELAASGVWPAWTGNVRSSVNDMAKTSIEMPQSWDSTASNISIQCLSRWRSFSPSATKSGWPYWVTSASSLPPGATPKLRGGISF